MDHEDWPRLTDEPYTSEQLKEFSERIYDVTGREVELDPEGNYYDIDYEALSNYAKVPDNKKNYILQNPIGKVFYMENLTEPGSTRVGYNPIISHSLELPKEYLEIIYVSSVIGDDITNIGSKQKPYKTIQKAEQQASEGSAILMDGTFVLGRGYQFKTGVDYIGTGKDTVLKGCQYGGNNVSIYKVVFDGQGYTESHTFQDSVNLFNVVYINQYSTEGTIEIFKDYNGTVKNSVFVNGNWNSLTHGSARINATNNVTGTSLSTGSIFDKNRIKLDSDYHIISPDGLDTTHGVYSGEHKWK